MVMRLNRGKRCILTFVSHGYFQGVFCFTHVTVVCCIVSDAEIVKALFMILTTDIVAIMDADVGPTIAEDTNSGISTLFPSFERAFFG